MFTTILSVQIPWDLCLVIRLRRGLSSKLKLTLCTDVIFPDLLSVLTSIFSQPLVNVLVDSPFSYLYQPYCGLSFHYTLGIVLFSSDLCGICQGLELSRSHVLTFLGGWVIYQPFY